MKQNTSTPPNIRKKNGGKRVISPWVYGSTKPLSPECIFLRKK
jgi:hypothetical protein